MPWHLAQNATTMLAIMGFSAYPDSMTLGVMDSVSRQNDTLGRLGITATQLQGYADAWGKSTEQVAGSRSGVRHNIQIRS